MRAPHSLKYTPLKYIPLLMTALAAASPAMAQEIVQEIAQEPANVIDTGNTAWILVCSALVMLMTPGLAFFYAGMVSRKNVVSTLMQSYTALAVVGLIWVTFGYSLAFSSNEGSLNLFIGSLDLVMLQGLQGSVENSGIPTYVFVAFQMMFAAITAAIISGSIVERVHFGGWVLLMALFTVCVYVPVAHWVWGGGWVAQDGGLDFAGGLVVHVTAGVAGLVSAILLGRRHNADKPLRPNDISMIMLGGALLWFGWFGFNAGSALAADGLAAHAFMTTFVGAASAYIGWMMVDWLRNKRPSATGATIGLVVGLVVITPAAGYVSVGHAILMCLISSVICNHFAHFMKSKTSLDDTLDVFACHGMGGILGAIMTGLFAQTAINPAVKVQGLLISGETELFVANLMGVVGTIAYTAIVTFVLIKVISLITPIRISEEEEKAGLDAVIHGEISRYHEREYDNAA